MRRRMSHIDIWMKNPTRTKNSKIHGHGDGAALVSVRSREKPLWLAHRGKNGRKTKLRQRQGPGHGQRGVYFKNNKKSQCSQPEL